MLHSATGFLFGNLIIVPRTMLRSNLLALFSLSTIPCITPYRSTDNPIRLNLDTLNVDIPIPIPPHIPRHLLPPSPHVLHKPLHILLPAQIHRLLILRNHPHLAPRRHIRQREIILVQPQFQRPFDLPAQDISSEPRLLARRPREAHAVDGLQRIDHGAHGLEAPGDVRLCLVQRGHNSLGEFEEEGFPLAGALALVHKPQLLVRAAAQLDEVEVGAFEARAEPFALVGVEAAGLEFDAVDFDPQHEVLGHAFVDRLGDFHDEARAVLEAAAVLVCAFVGGGGEELGEQVPVRAVQFEAVVAGCVEVFGCVGEVVGDFFDFRVGGRVWFLERHAQDLALQLHIRCRDGVFLKVAPHLAARVAQLTEA